MFESLQEKTNLSSGKSELQMFFPISGLFSYFSYFPISGPQEGTNMASPLCGTFCQITRVRNTAQTRARLFESRLTLIHD